MILEQCAAAVAALRDDTLPVEQRVHETRKRLKEARAVVRLFRGPLGEAFQIENRWYRDAGHEIAAYRDADAAVEAVRSLGRATRDQIGRGGMSKLLRTVRARRAAQFADPEELRGRVANLLAQLPVGAARLHDTPLAAGGFAAIASGLRRTYGDGRRAMHAASDEPSFHRWRKRVKDHWYHLQLLTPLWPELLEARAGVLRTLSRLLGDHHDLAVVRALLTDDSLRDALRDEQKKLQAQALDIGAKVYAQKARDFVREVEAWWDAG